jgi:hypothetical protein
MKHANQIGKIAFIALAILITLTFAASAANAATLEWKTNSQIDSCACEAQRFTVQINNDGSTTQKFFNRRLRSQRRRVLVIRFRQRASTR